MIDDTLDESAGAQELTGCAHVICQCTLMGAVRGATYCSDACRAADDNAIESESCPCGHPPCDAPL